MTVPAIQTEGLVRDFGPVRALDHLTLEVPAGIVFGFLGPNGAGKTTAIRALLGLVDPTAGRATVLGFDTRSQSDEIRERSGALLEHHGLYERLTAEQNLDLAGRIWHMSRLDRRGRTRELLEQFGLWDRRKEPAGHWSRGMKQKLAVARAVYHRPPLVFLDEPTAGLDPVASAALRDDLATLATGQGVTVFLTTHNLVEAERLCALVGVIRRGRLVALGPPGSLLQPSTSVVRITGVGLDVAAAEAVLALPDVAAARMDGDALEVRLASGATNALVVESLVSRGVAIDEVRRERQSLEEAFLELVSDDATEATMLRDTLTVAWKEWREFRDQLFRLRRGGLSALVVVLMLGVFTPLQMGEAWLTSPLMLGYWPLLSSGMVSTLIADAFAGERERHTLEALLATRLSDGAILAGKIVSAVLYGVLFTVANIAIGFVTVTLSRLGQPFVTPAPLHLAYILVLVVLACLTLAGVGIFISLRATTVRQAQQTLGVIMMVLFIGPFVFFQFLDVDDRVNLAARLTALGTDRIVGWVSGVLLVVSAILVGLARVRFRRGRLTLD